MVTRRLSFRNWNCSRKSWHCRSMQRRRRVKRKTTRSVSRSRRRRCRLALCRKRSWRCIMGSSYAGLSCTQLDYFLILSSRLFILQFVRKRLREEERVHTESQKFLLDQNQVSPDCIMQHLCIDVSSSHREWISGLEQRNGSICTEFNKRVSLNVSLIVFKLW